MECAALILGALGAIMFLVRTQMLPITGIAPVPEWAQRLDAVLAELPDDMVEARASRGSGGLASTGWPATAPDSGTEGSVRPLLAHEASVGRGGG